MTQTKTITIFFSAIHYGNTYDEGLLVTILYSAFRVITGSIGIAWVATSTAMLKEILENNINRIWLCSKSDKKSNTDTRDEYNMFSVSRSDLPGLPVLQQC